MRNNPAPQPHIKPDYRIGRIAMLALVTGATAFGFSGGTAAALLALVSGLGTAVAGFYLDHALDRVRDLKSGAGANPLAIGSMHSLAAGLLIGAGALAATLPALLGKPLALLPPALVWGTILILHVRRLETPVVRAAGLGVLQALYVFLGAIWAGAPFPRSAWLAVFLFFAMTGGKVLGDVRDLTGDEKTGTPTIPRRFGLVFACVFLCALEAAAYGVGIAAALLGGFSLYFLAAMLITAAVGSGLLVYFCLKPTPERARRANGLSLGVLGLLYVAAMAIEGILRLR
jgi:4-hydroxybenzoate polyprenyltransferase